jgi:hypothetical protein
MIIDSFVNFHSFTQARALTTAKMLLELLFLPMDEPLSDVILRSRPCSFASCFNSVTFHEYQMVGAMGGL